MKRTILFLFLFLFLGSLAQAQVWTKRDIFDRAATTNANGSKKWVAIPTDNNTGSLQINADTSASGFNSTAGQLAGGSAWDSLHAMNSFVGVVLKQKLLNTQFFSWVLMLASTKDNAANGYRLRYNDDGGVENIQLQRVTGATNGTTLATKNLTSPGAAGDTSYIKEDSASTYTIYWKHAATGVIDSISATDNTYNISSGAYVWIRMLIGTPPLKISAFMTAPLARKIPPPPPTSDSVGFSNMHTAPPGTVNQPPIRDTVKTFVDLIDLFTNFNKVVFRIDGARRDSIIYSPSVASATATSKSLAAGNRGQTHTYDFLVTTDALNTFTSLGNNYLCLGDTGITWQGASAILTQAKDTVQLQVSAYNLDRIKYLVAYQNGVKVDSIYYGPFPYVQTAVWTTKKLASGVFNQNQNYYFKGETDSAKIRTSPTFSYLPTNRLYWHTVHFANWAHADMPVNQIPWDKITHLIHFAGKTGGAQTCGTCGPGGTTASPFWIAPNNWEIDNAYNPPYHIGDTLRAYGKRYGVAILMDLGFNSNNDYGLIANTGGLPAMQAWAGQVAHYMVNWQYDGGDLDFEGGAYPTNGGGGKFASLLIDSLRSLNPGKKYIITTSIMGNVGDLRGYLTGNGGASNAQVSAAVQYYDQINPMFYDVSGTWGSPLYPDPSCGSTWSTDSAVSVNFINAGVPSTKQGMGYNIQVYHSNTTVACPPGGFAYIGQLFKEVQYFPPAAGAAFFFNNVSKQAYMINTNMGVKIAYEDTLSTAYKADFIQRHNMGGAMGFCLDRGYWPNPPVGVSKNMAVYGMGKALNGGQVFIPPPPAPNAPTLWNPRSVDTSVAKDTTIASWQPDPSATLYNVQIATDVNFISMIVNTSVTQPFYSFAANGVTLQNGTYYWWRVATVNGNGTSPWSTVGNFRTKTVVVSVPPTAPVLLLPAQGALNIDPFASFYWHPNPKVDSVTTYRQQLSFHRNFDTLMQDVPQLADTTCSAFVTLNYSTWYYWRVYAYKQTLVGPASVTDSFQTRPAVLPPTAPVLVIPTANAVNVAVDTTLFTWRKIQIATSYGFQLALDPGYGSLVMDVFQVDTFASVLNQRIRLNNGTVYYWRVYAHNNSGNSAWTTSSFTTVQQVAVNPPSQPVPTLPTQGATGVGTTTALSWNYLFTDSASSFRALVARTRLIDTTNGTGVDFDRTTAQPPVSLSGLNNLTWYFWRVQTQKGALKSVWSALDSFQTGSVVAELRGTIHKPLAGDPARGSAQFFMADDYLTMSLNPGTPPIPLNKTKVQWSVLGFWDSTGHFNAYQIGAPIGGFLNTDLSNLTYPARFFGQVLLNSLSGDSSLYIIGGAYISGGFKIGGRITASGLTLPVGAVNNYLWTSDANGVGRWSPPPLGVDSVRASHLADSTKKVNASGIVGKYTADSARAAWKADTSKTSHMADSAKAVVGGGGVAVIPDYYDIVEDFIVPYGLPAAGSTTTVGGTLGWYPSYINGTQAVIGNLGAFSTTCPFDSGRFGMVGIDVPATNTAGIARGGWISPFINGTSPSEATQTALIMRNPKDTLFFRFFTPGDMDSICGAMGMISMVNAVGQPGSAPFPASDSMGHTGIWGQAGYTDTIHGNSALIDSLRGIVCRGQNYTTFKKRAIAIIPLAPNHWYDYYQTVVDPNTVEFGAMLDSVGQTWTRKQITGNMPNSTGGSMPFLGAWGYGVTKTVGRGSPICAQYDHSRSFRWDRVKFRLYNKNVGF